MFNTHIERDLAAVKVAELHRQAAEHRLTRAEVRGGRVPRTAATRRRLVAPAPVVVDAAHDCCA